MHKVDIRMAGEISLEINGDAMENFEYHVKVLASGRGRKKDQMINSLA